MKRTIKLSLFAGVLSASFVLFGWSGKKVTAFSGGPDPSLTGAPGEGTCSGCHSGGAPGGTLQITGLPANYAPDQEYILTVTIAQQGRPRFGFQTTVIDGAGRQAGTLIVSDTARTQSVTGNVGGNQRTYIEHTSAGNTPTSTGESIWTFHWRAPVAGTGRVTFYVAGVGANGDFTSFGDSVYTTNVSSDQSNQAQNPVPIIDSLSPSPFILTGQSSTLTVIGTNFTPSSVVRFNGADRPTQYVSATELKSTITTSDIGIRSVIVFNPAPGGGTSNTVSLAVTQPNRSVQVVATSIQRGQTGTVSIELVANGNENGLGFSLNFDPVQLTYVHPSGGDNKLMIGPGMPPGSSIDVNDSQLSFGRIGIAVVAPFGGTILAGTRQVLNLTFMATTSGSGNSTSVGFGNTPRPQELADALGNPLAASFSAGTITLTGPEPRLTSLNPTSVSAGSSAFTLTVNGANFLPGPAGSVVQWNGADRPTTFVSTTQLTAAIPASDVINTGSAQIQVLNPGPNPGPSNQIAFGINPDTFPAPTITAITPSAVTTGSGAFMLTVNGTNLFAVSTIRVNGSDRATTFISGTELRTAISAADIQTVGVLGITVFNPAPGGGLSNAVPLSVGNTVPVIFSITPAQTFAGSGLSSLIVDGANFVPSSYIKWNGAERATSYMSAGRLTTMVDAADLSQVGTVNIEVFTPAPGGGISNIRPFSILANPAPFVSSVNPSFWLSNGSAFELSVTGGNFLPISTILWKGGERSTAYVSPSNVRTIITAADLMLPGEAQVQVRNPQPGGGTSGPISFQIRQLSITSLQPSMVIAGGAGFALTVNGQNFDGNTKVYWNGAERTTFYINSTELIATINGSDISSGGVAQITVATADFGVVTSNSFPLTVVDSGMPDTAGIFRAGFFWLQDVNGDRMFVEPPDRSFAFGGVPGDIPITGDWNGDGKSKVGIYRPINGLFILDYDGDTLLTEADKVYNLGVGKEDEDVLVVGDWNGDGRTKVGLFRQGFFWILDYNGNGLFEQGIDKTYAFGGVAGDIPVVGDWNGTGTSKLGLLRQGFYWILDANGNGAFDGTGAGQDFAFAFGGIAGDIPVVGDWNGDGRTKVGMFRQGFFWVLDANGNQQFDGTDPGADLAFPFGGISGDKPVVGKW